MAKVDVVRYWNIYNYEIYVHSARVIFYLQSSPVTSSFQLGRWYARRTGLKAFPWLSNPSLNILIF